MRSILHCLVFMLVCVLHWKLHQACRSSKCCAESTSINITNPLQKGALSHQAVVPHAALHNFARVSFCRGFVGTLLHPHSDDRERIPLAISAQ